MQKLYHSISEVSGIVDEEQHILRYWEQEFSLLKPKKNRGGKRIYSEKDIAVIKLIKKLIRDDKLSLKGAKENIEKAFSAAEEIHLNGGENSIPEVYESVSSKIPKNENNSNYITLKKDDLREILNTFKAFSGYLEKY